MPQNYTANFPQLSYFIPVIGGYRMKFAYSFIIFFLLSVILFIKCEEESTNQTEIHPRANAYLSITSGNLQTGNANEELPNSIIITARDSSGNVFPNIILNITVVEGDGELITESPLTTDGRGEIKIRWKIGSNYNALKVYQAEEGFTHNKVFVYANTTNPQGMNKTLSLNTLDRINENFYYIELFGEYSEILERENRRFLGNIFDTQPNNYFCSLFTAYGDSSSSLFGRSFDNPADWHCLTLMMRTHPTDGYNSLSLMRLRDIGFEIGTDLLQLPWDDKVTLLDAVFHCPDGINEYGVVAGLANVRELSFTPDNSKPSIWVTYLVREILDHARNVDEAIGIMRQYNICCPSRTRLGVHVLVADPDRSVILEMAEGEIKVIPNDEPWQVITNSPSYNVSIETQKNTCGRFRRIYNRLEDSYGKLDANGFVDLLSTVGWSSTEWSAVYDMRNKFVKLFIDYDFSREYNFDVTEILITYSHQR